MTEQHPGDGIFADEHEVDAHEQAPPASTPGSRRAPRRRSRVRGCLPVLIVIVIVAGLGYFGVTKGIDAIQNAFGDPDDFDGPGKGRLTFEVQEGETASQIGRDLEKQGVVASEEAFTDAASDAGAALQPGVFVLKKEMKASDVVKILGNAANDRSLSLTLLPGKSVEEVVGLLAKYTDFTKAQYQKVLDDPKALGLPSYADGDPQGYLFPGKYLFGPDDTPTTILTTMVDRFNQAADDVDLEGGADKLGYTPQQVMTVASLLQAEGRADVQPKIARVVYNRLEIEPNPTAGFLQIDATVNYALGEDPNKLTVRLTQAQIDSVSDSPYNTYTQKGLPPGPIEAPGQSAIEAALKPADGPWFWYVTVNLKTGETKFTDSDAERLQFRSELDEYCETKSDVC